MKINKILIALFTIIGAFFMFGSVSKVNASTLTQNKYDDIWIDSNNTDEYRGMTDKFAEYNIDGDVTYCIEPNVSITTSNYLGQVGYINSPYDYELNRKLQLIGYYGYDYPGHQTLRYRMATQILIWKSIRPTQDFKFWTKANGQGDFIDISYEENEILRLVNLHDIKPSFEFETKNATIGKSIDFVDTTGVLSNFEVVNNNGIATSINGNTLTLTPNQVGKVSVRLRMKKYTEKETTLFVGDNGTSQKMGKFGLDDPYLFEVYLNVSGASLEIIKKDKDTNTSTPQGDATLAGAEYDLTDINGNHITYLITDDQGRAKTDNILSLDTKYLLKEMKAPNGYTLNENVYEVNIGEKLEVTFEVEEKVKEKDVDVFKLFANGNTGVTTPEPNIKFNIFLKSTGEYFKSITTNENGFASITLPYGTWTFKQVNTTPGYEKVEDFDVEIIDNDGKITKYLSNAPITAKLKVIKVDSETGNRIKRSNIKFKIFDITRNEYVCQKITYPFQKEICEFNTNEEGEFITPYPLLSGTYRLEELDQLIDKYTWNSISKEFEIGENSEFKNDNEFGIVFETKFENTQVKGNVSIKKLGEKLIKEKGNFYYEEILLDNVEYELYASEDIISGDGSLIYKKNELIGTFVTKDGYILIENLFLGKYYLLEKTTVGNHILDTQRHYFELAYKNQYTPTVEINFTYKNYLTKGVLEFTKTDLVTGEPLPNTRINIYDANTNELIFDGYTDENGKIIINNLYVSKFVLYEVEAPENYILNPEPMEFEIKENGDIIKSVMTNEKMVVDVPITLKNDNLSIILINLLILSSGVILYGITKRKKHK